VLAGCGISFLPTWLVADALRQGALEIVLPDCRMENMVAHAVWPMTRSLAPKIRVVVDTLVERLKSPPWDRSLPLA